MPVFADSLIILHFSFSILHSSNSSLLIDSTEQSAFHVVQRVDSSVLPARNWVASPVCSSVG